MPKFILLTLLSLGLAIGNADARSKRVNQIPNGGVNRCANCHVDPNGGGPRNVFGREVGKNFLDGSGNVIWGAALAALDSDSDGKTNGEELQDADGVWRSGDANPGDADLVSNPGDPNSTTNVQLAMSTPLQFTLKQNYPNPFNPSTTISFVIPQSAQMRLTIHNSLGQPIRELLNGALPPGEHSVVWNGLNDAGQFMGSGVYLARLEGKGFSQTIRMLLMK